MATPSRALRCSQKRAPQAKHYFQGEENIRAKISSHYPEKSRKTFDTTAPAPRAWFYVWRGDYVTAARIYEKALARHPHYVSLYLKLADLYLLAGRRDRRAMTVYTMMQLLHLVSRHLEESDNFFEKYPRPREC